jgi:hypothetical protein
MDMTTLANPFRVWGEMARSLRDRFVRELEDRQSVSPHRDEVLTEMATIIASCQCLGYSLQRMQQADPKAFAAFLRAMEGS